MIVRYESEIEPMNATLGSAAYDLIIKDIEIIDKIKYRLVKVTLDIRTQFDSDYVALLLPRSSIKNSGLIMANSIGVIDSDYPNHYIMFLYDFPMLYNTVDELPFKIGERAAQVMFVKKEYVSWVPYNFTETEFKTRIGGFGSTGK